MCRILRILRQAGTLSVSHIIFAEYYAKQNTYLFVIAMQVLTALFNRAELRGDIEPVSCGTLSVSHIIFADDLMVFLKADKKNFVLDR